MNLICKFKGHDLIVKQVIDDTSGLYQGNMKLMSTKEYQCSRCGKTARGLGLSKEDHLQMMNYAVQAKAQHEYDMAFLPQRVQELEAEIKRLKAEK